MQYKYAPLYPTDVGLPHKEFWSGQREGVEQVLDLWHQGIRVVMVNGPTGAGKSLVGVGSAATYAMLHEMDLDVTVLTQTKDLQNQYVEEFDTAECATGRSNHSCATSNSIRANRCPYIGTPTPCDFDCPYRIQRDRAKLAPIRAINYALYGATGDLFHAPIMIADEADYLGELLVQAKSADLSLLVQEYGLEVPQGYVNHKELDDVLLKIAEDSASPEEREACKHGRELLVSKKWAVKGVGNFLVPYPESKIVQAFVRQPTIIMSATVFAPQYWSKEWNIPIGWVELPCAVPASNRPIRLMNTMKINARTTEFEWLTVIEEVDRLVAEMLSCGNDKGVVHSVSNHLTDLILKHSKYKYLMIKAAGETRLKGINTFLNTKRGILIGPNLLRGLNLPDDQCRFIIFPKIPYPHMGDPRIQEMLKGGEERYQV